MISGSCKERQNPDLSKELMAKQVFLQDLEYDRSFQSNVQ
jgi:hypothetical protein